MKSKVILFLSILIIAANFSCDKELVEQSNEDILKTVSIDTALDFVNNVSSRNSNGNYISQAFPEFLSQEQITDTGALLTSIPLITENSNMFSRLLLLNINGNDEAVIFSMLPDNEYDSENFSGEILITDIDGNFLNGYKVTDNELVSQYVDQNSSRNSNLNSNSNRFGEECPDCPYSDCTYCGDIGEVVIIGGGSGGGYVFIDLIFSNAPQFCESTDCGTNGWDFDSGGGSGNGNNNNYQMIFEGPDNAVENIEEYLDCFNTTQGANITIYVDQPISNSDAPFTTNADKAGHAYIEITQNGITRVLGFYPEGNASPLYPSDPHIFGNNSGDAFDVSITFSASGAYLWNIIDYTINFNLLYNLNSSNCTDYVLDIAGLCGISLPDPQSNWTGGGGSNPGAFGQAIRNMELPDGMTRNTEGGNSSNNSGNCN